MAHAYTTKRGKTKKAKLGKRKDLSNNKANKLKTKIQADVPLEFASEKVNYALEDGNDRNIHHLKDKDSVLQLNVSCANPQCSKLATKHNKLSICSGCSSVMYCDASCQRTHWPTHKEDCKSIQSKKAEEAKKNEDWEEIIKTLDAYVAQMNNETSS